MGYNVLKTPYSKDQGADLILERFEEMTVVQAKRYKGNVGNSAVQEVVASKAYYQATEGMVVTNSFFTSSAIELARPNNIELIDRIIVYDIENLINFFYKFFYSSFVKCFVFDYFFVN